MNEQKQCTVAEAVREGTRKLLDSGIENAEYDSFMMLAQLNGMDRTDYYARGNRLVPVSVYEDFMASVARRAKHVPLQHILGKTWFYGYEFEVNESVLIPRPDTEVLVETALKRIADGMCVLDLCTGSGCIILTIAKQRQLKAAVGTDISQEALAVAARNRNHLGAHAVRLCQSDLFEQLGDWRGQFDVIVSNPPYIRTDEIETLSEEVRGYDPHLALDGFADGLHFYREITRQSVSYLKPGGWLIYEIGSEQGIAVLELLRLYGFGEVSVVSDLAGLDRVVLGRKA